MRAGQGGLEGGPGGNKARPVNHVPEISVGYGAPEQIQESMICSLMQSGSERRREAVTRHTRGSGCTLSVPLQDRPSSKDHDLEVLEVPHRKISFPSKGYQANGVKFLAVKKQPKIFVNPDGVRPTKLISRRLTKYK